MSSQKNIFKYRKDVTGVGEGCDECGREIGIETPTMNYIRVQVWADDPNRFERVFCDVECMKVYIKKWKKNEFW
jgi:hypothetical protein